MLSIFLALALLVVSEVQSDVFTGLTIHSEDKPYDARRFPAKYALDLVDEAKSRTYWLLPNKVVNEGFVVDLGSVKQVESVSLTNTHNWNYNDRGTNEFEINLSIDGTTFTKIGAGSLTDARKKSLLAEVFGFSGRGRYLQFLVKSYYGNGAGLQFIKVSGRDAAPAACLSGDQVSIASEDKAYDARRFPAKYALKYVDEGKSRTYWLLPNKVVDEGFVVDLGSVKTVESVSLTNTHNWNYNDRGTQGFEINISSDGSSFSQIGSGTLTDVRKKSLQTEEFSFSGTGRYVQFKVKSVYGNGAGLQHIAVCVSPAALSGLTIASEDKPYDTRRFPAKYALRNEPAESASKRIYWLLPNKVVDQGFVVDLQAVRSVSAVALTNTQNAQYDDRGTKDFELLISSDGKTFTKIASGTLTDVRRKTLFAEGFPAAGTGRYLKFVAKSYYGNGAGLQYIEVIGA